MLVHAVYTVGCQKSGLGAWDWSVLQSLSSPGCSRIMFPPTRGHQSRQMLNPTWSRSLSCAPESATLCSSTRSVLLVYLCLYIYLLLHANNERNSLNWGLSLVLRTSCEVKSTRHCPVYDHWWENPGKSKIPLKI